MTLHAAFKQSLGMAAIIASAVLLSSCDLKKNVLGVVDIQVIAGQTYKAPSVASFTVEGGESDTRLTQVLARDAIAVRIVDKNGVAISGGVIIPAGKKVKFGPGLAQRVELSGVNRIPRLMNEIELSFAFALSDTQIATVPYITPAGAQKPEL